MTHAHRVVPKSQEPGARSGGKTLVLSDLHLGRVTTYAHAPEVIAPLVEGFERVLLLGDIIDHWYTHPRQVKALEQRILSVCKSGGVREVIYFRGNHDACCETGEEFRVLDGMLYLHGHVVYQRLPGAGATHERIAELNARKYGSHLSASRLDKRIWTVIDRVYGTIPMAMISPFAWPLPVLWRIRTLVTEVAPLGTIRGVVLGHSHRPGVRQFDGLTLFNLGGWMKNTRACAFVREGPRIQLVHIENRRHHLRWGKVLHDSVLNG
jgi:predicted phosphodiesterase